MQGLVFEVRLSALESGGRERGTWNAITYGLYGLRVHLKTPRLWALALSNAAALA